MFTSQMERETCETWIYVVEVELVIDWPWQYAQKEIGGSVAIKIHGGVEARWSPRLESNQYPTLRRHVHYPLCYGEDATRWHYSRRPARCPSKLPWI